MIAVCPPNCTTAPSGFSKRTIFSTSSGVNGSKYNLSGDIKVCTYRLRIVIYNDRLITFLRQRPHTVYRAIVKLDTLSDSDRVRNRVPLIFLRSWLSSTSFSPSNSCIIRRFGSKFCCAGIYHLKRCGDTILIAKVLDLLFCFSCPTCDHVIREFHTLCLFEKFFI